MVCGCVILPVVISFFAIPPDDTERYFRTHAEYFSEECERLDLEYRIESLPDRGTWRLNSHYKPQCILNQLQELQEPVLWLDIDLKVACRPELPDEYSGCDWASIRYTEQHVERKHKKGGTRDCMHFVNPTDRSFAVLRSWIDYCVLKPKSGDHSSWGQAYNEHIATEWNHRNLELPVFPERLINLVHPCRHADNT